MFGKTDSRIVLTLLLLSISALAFDVQPVKSEPRTWAVDDDGPADFHTIGGAVNAADLGDIVFVHSGTYYENVVINKTVSLIGEDRNTTIIDGNLTGYVVWIQANKVTIKRFTIQRSGTYMAVSLGIYFDNSNNSEINENLITTNGDGILLVNACNNLIHGNIITNNVRGIRLHWSCNNNILYKNRMINNRDDGIQYLVHPITISSSETS